VSNIASKDKKLGKIYKRLYQEAIDFGAHPNERSVSSNMIHEAAETESRWIQVYLHEDGLALDNALVSTARTGLCCLFIFAQIFETRFQLLGLDQQMQALREYL